jgi:hypothetical protein
MAPCAFSSLARIADDDVAEPRLQVFEVAGQAKDRHHFRSDRDIEAGFARIAVGNPAKRADDFAECPVVHVDHAAPGDAAGIDAERIAPIDVIVDQRREQIMRRRDRMEIAGEMEVDVLHRDHLRVAAAGGPALDAEAGPERRLAQAQHRLLADVVERVGEADRGRGLAFAGRRRIDRGDEDELAVGLLRQRLDVAHRNLGLVVAVGLEIFFADAEFFLGDVDDAPGLRGLGDFNIGFRTLMLRGGHCGGALALRKGIRRSACRCRRRRR